MQEQKIIETQLDFYKRGAAGCLFAAHAAHDPEGYEWRLNVCVTNPDEIEQLMQSAITTLGVSTQSIIFPTVITEKDLLNFLKVLLEVPSIHIGQKEKLGNVVCLGYRVKVGDLHSWVTGFGNFGFLPQTRQAVFTEITFRSKPRPNYAWIMKEAPEGIIHLADMDMKGMGENKFKALWYGSFDNTEKRLGSKPDLRSAAKTTFAIPSDLYESTP